MPMHHRHAHAASQHYDALASHYDRRWHAYISASLDATLARLELDAGAAVLDIGCGSGELLHRLAGARPDLSLTGIEPSAGMLGVAAAKARPDARLIRADAELLPFADSSFDAVTCTSVLHHLPDPAAALAEIHRVLKPGGLLVLTDWCGDYFFYRLLTAWLRCTGRPVAQVFRASGCRALLEQAGFRVETVDRFRVGRLWRLMTAMARRETEASPR